MGKGATTKSLMATLEHIQSLHAECDWLLQYFVVRKEARAGEVESLKTAKSVLSGMDSALLQTGRSLRGARLLDSSKACVADDLKHRAQLQNKLAGVCVDMCKEVGAFPKCTCPDFVAPDSTPGVMTWPELLEHMDNLSEWGHGQLKAWNGQASQLQIETSACVTQDLQNRARFQNKLAGVCVDMCKEVGAFPKCTCPDFVAPDSTPGV